MTCAKHPGFVLKTTDEVWEPYRLVSLVLKSGTRYSGTNHAVLYAQNDRWGLVPIETCNTGTKVAVLHAKTTDEGWDP